MDGKKLSIENKNGSPKKESGIIGNIIILPM